MSEFTSKKYIKRHNFDFWKFINDEYPNINDWKDKISFYSKNLHEDDIFEKLKIDNKTILIPKWENLSRSQRVESFIKRIYPDFWQLLMEKYPNIKCWAKKLKYFRSGIPEEDICHLVMINGEQILVPSDKVFCTSGCRETYLKVNYFGFYNYLENTYPFIKDWNERIFLYKSNMLEPLRCPVCGNYTKYDKDHSKYYTFCCCSCSCKGTMDKRKQTNMIIYGTTHPMKTQECQDKVKNTKLERYGDGNFNNPEQNKQTCLKRYGVSNSMNLQSTRDKSSRTKKENYMNTCDFIVGISPNNNYLCKCPYPECDLCEQKIFEIKSPVLSRRLIDETILCDKYLLTKTFESRSKIEKKVCKILDKYKIPYETNVKNLIQTDKGHFLELDVYLKQYNLAIEINGQMFHSMFNPKTKKDQHILKHLKCVDKGIELVYLWEDWIDDDSEMVEKFILDKINGKDLNTYKKRWFPDLDDSRWPLDLGWCSGSEQEIIEHHCYHGKFLCFDSGVVKMPV